MTEMHHLVGVAEVAEMLGVTRQRVNAIVQTHDDFPQAEVVLSAGRVWRRSDIDAWAERRRTRGASSGEANGKPGDGRAR